MLPEVKSGAQARKSFAFFIHPTDEHDALFGLQAAFPGLERDKLDQILAWVRSFADQRLDTEPVAHIDNITSPTGASVHGWLVFSSFTAREMMQLNRKAKERLLDSYVQTARRLGADYIGLGAFTSVLSRAGEYFRDCGIPVTTGNSYTALCSVKAVEQVLHVRGQRPQHKSAAVIGAYGSIGRTISQYAMGCYGALALIGNAANSNAQANLEQLAAALIGDCLQDGGADAPLASHVRQVLRGEPRPVSYGRYLELCQARQVAPALTIVTVQPGVPIGADVVYCATSNGGAFLTLDVLAGAQIVCDIARPSDLDRALLDDSGITYIEGGLSSLPQPFTFGAENLQGFPPEINLGCLSETIALTMDGQSRSYSVGAQVPLAEALEVYEICLRHGFRPHTELPLAAPARQHAPLEAEAA
jgi:predicted amino acid dehydrogenase